VASITPPHASLFPPQVMRSHEDRRILAHFERVSGQNEATGRIAVVAAPIRSPARSYCTAWQTSRRDNRGVAPGRSNRNRYGIVGNMAAYSSPKEISMSRDKPQAQTPQKHPEPYQHDLNPNAMAGQNIGLGETEPFRHAPTALRAI
jgi:hypothetical protein